MGDMEVDGLAIAAHELKTPLVAIRQLALTMELAENERERMKISQDIVSLSEKAMRQVVDLLKLQKIRQSGESVDLSPISVRAVCEEVLGELNDVAKLNKKKFKVNYRNRARLAVANRDLLFGVIYNFCVNAINYSAEEESSSLLTYERDNQIWVQVRDFGPVLSERVWRMVREGVDRPVQIAMRPGSSGLGLLIATQFAREMGASLDAIRHRNGTSFIVKMPISKQVELF